jgi:hypothetical protein
VSVTSAAIDAATQVIAMASLGNRGDAARDGAVALADRGMLLTPLVLTEITAAARAEVVAEVRAEIEARSAEVRRQGYGPAADQRTGMRVALGWVSEALDAIAPPAGVGGAS